MGVRKIYQKIPDSPGVYLMKDARGRILYIGKAGNLRRRVSSYFTRPHDYRIERLVREVKKVDCKKTDTAIEALILESELIKKYQPPFNVREKDDTSFLYVEITKEAFPRVLLVRGKTKPVGKRYGPFTSATSIRQAMRILRKIFPYSIHPNTTQISKVKSQISGGKNQNLGKPCFDYQIGLCPGTCIGAISAVDYRKNISNLERIFQGKKKTIIRSLNHEMKQASKNLEFEKAEKIKRQLFAIQHVRDIALITDEGPVTRDKEQGIRIEGYDISNISGTSAVGSMVVFKGESPDKNEYRKFKIRIIRQSDDVGMLKEVLRRRFSHTPESGGWPLPSLILIDGGKGQVNGAKQVLNEAGLKIQVVGIAKGPTRKKNEIVGKIPEGITLKTLIKVRDEAHRFAITYHKKVRSRKFLAE